MKPTDPGRPQASGTDVLLPGSRSALDPRRAIKPGRHGLSPETVAGIQRERLIDAFVQVVCEHGFARTTISRVTEGAGVTKKTFYTHFSDLDECFLAAYQRGSAILLKRMSEVFHAAPSWPEGIRDTLGTMLAILAREPLFARASLIEVNAAGPRVRRARIDYLAHFREFFIDPEVMPSPAPPLVVVDAIVGGIYSAIYVRVELGETEQLPSLLPSLTYFALLPLIGREEALAYLETDE